MRARIKQFKPIYNMKKNRIKNILLLLFLGIFLNTACDYAYVEPEVTPLPDVISFSTHIVPIFNSSCNMSGCHNSGGFAPDLTPANAYNDLFAENLIDTINPANSGLYTKINGGSMTSYSTPSNNSFILLWIQQGAKNN